MVFSSRPGHLSSRILPFHHHTKRLYLYFAASIYSAYIKELLRDIIFILKDGHLKFTEASQLPTFTTRIMKKLSAIFVNIRKFYHLRAMHDLVSGSCHALTPSARLTSRYLFQKRRRLNKFYNAKASFQMMVVDAVGKYEILCIYILFFASRYFSRWFCVNVCRQLNVPPDNDNVLFEMLLRESYLFRGYLQWQLQCQQLLPVDFWATYRLRFLIYASRASGRDSLKFYRCQLRHVNSYRL